MDAKHDDALLKVYGHYMERYNVQSRLYYSDLRHALLAFAVIVAGTLWLIKERLLESGLALGLRPTLIATAGGLLALACATLGRRAFSISYTSWLTTVATLVKLEADLGLHQPETRRQRQAGAEPLVWGQEQWLYPGFLETAGQHPSSAAFVAASLNRRYGQIGLRTLRGAQILGALLLLLGAADLLRLATGG
jgi:hypothetical protein